MQRKAIQLNPTTLAVTLPKQWADAHRVKKGMQLEVEASPKELVVRTGKQVSAERVTIDLPRIGTFEKNFISTLYQAGVDELKVIYDDPAIVPVIQEHIDRYLVGFDIVEQTKDRLLIKSIAEGIELDFEKMYRKNNQLMVRMMREIDEAVQQNEYENIRNTRALEQHENKVHSLCLRYVSKKGFPMNPKRERAAYELIREVENICDSMKRICDVLEEERPRIGKRLKGYVAAVTRFVENFYSLYYTPKPEYARHFFDDGKKILAEGYAFFSRKEEHLMLVHHLIDIINRVYFLSHPYFEIIN